MPSATCDAAYEVRASAIHGLGLFAVRFIAEGEMLGECEVRPAVEDGPHVLWIEDDAVPVRVVNDLKYINHDAANPSACYYDDLTVVALRDIRPGEEITHDYGGDWHDAGPAVGAAEPAVAMC